MSAKVKAVEGGGWSYLCPCGDYHYLDGRWKFDGNVEAPTFAPSVHVRCGHYVRSHKPDDPCWCKYNREHPEDPAPVVCYVCHSFVRGGVVEFLGDCTHKYANQKVPLPDWPHRN